MLLVSQGWKITMIKRDQNHCDEIQEVFPQGQHIEVVVQRWPRLHFKLAAALTWQCVRISSMAMVWKACGVLESSWSLALWEARRATDQSAASAAVRLRIWETRTMGWAPRTAAGLAWSQPEPMKQAMCAVHGRVGEMRLLKPFSSSKIHESQMLDAELITLVNFDCFDLTVTVP